MRPRNIIDTARARPVRRDQLGGDHRADPEQRPVRQPRQNPRREQQLEVRRERRGHVPDDEQAREHQQQPLVRHPRADRRQQRRTDHHAQRVGGHNVARGRHGHRQTVGDLREQPHGDELGRTDAERDDGQGEQSQGHGRGKPSE
ncbi:hypothetical protein RKD35_006673 [Streptomyces albogriseolus]